MNLSRLKQKVAGLPRESGVYFFYGKAKSASGGRVKRGPLLYIGKATNLRTRVQSYFRGVISSEVDPLRLDAKKSFRIEARKSYTKKGSDLSTSLRYAQNDRKDKIQEDRKNISQEDIGMGIDMNLQVEHLEQLQHPESSIVPGRSEWIGSMMPLVEEIEFEQTDSVLEALILESNLIKKHQPKYNTLEKDDKSFAYFVITKEEFPRVLIMRKTDIEKVNILNSMSLRGGTPAGNSSALPSSGSFFTPPRADRDDGQGVNKLKAKKLMPEKLQATFGPYTSKQQMQIALKIIRRIFPFHAGKQKTEKGCLDFQLGLCPGPYAGAISKEDYKKNIDGIKLILAGKKKSLLSGLGKEMKTLAKNNEFEKAAEVRNKIFALEHIRDVALITRDMEHGTWNNNQKTIINNQEKTEAGLSLRGSTLPKQSRALQGSGSFTPPRVDCDDRNGLKAKSYKLTPVRIEAYDISNISGTDAVGSMVVFSARGGNWQPDKSEYRKFKIKTVDGSNDVAMMKEILLRRFKNDWPASTRGDDRSSTRGWPMPDLILLDGGQGHVNMAEKLLRQELGLDVAIVGVAKGPTRKNLKLQTANFKQNTIYNIQNTLEINSQNFNNNVKLTKILTPCHSRVGGNPGSNTGLDSLFQGNDITRIKLIWREIENILQDKLLIKQIMDEAHRFAITFHRKLRRKNALRD